jgi:hypothetical protein
MNVNAKVLTKFSPEQLIARTAVMASAANRR